MTNRKHENVCKKFENQNRNSALWVRWKNGSNFFKHYNFSNKKSFIDFIYNRYTFKQNLTSVLSVRSCWFSFETNIAFSNTHFFCVYQGPNTTKRLLHSSSCYCQLRCMHAYIYACNFWLHHYAPTLATISINFTMKWEFARRIFHGFTLQCV